MLLIPLSWNITLRSEIIGSQVFYETTAFLLKGQGIPEEKNL
jgi:hypothetical protein